MNQKKISILSLHIFNNIYNHALNPQREKECSMVNAAKFGCALQRLIRMVSSGDQVTESHLRDLVVGTSLEPTPAVLRAVCQAVDSAKSAIVEVDGKLIEATTEHLASVRGPFYFVRLAGEVYRQASRITEAEWLRSRPKVSQPPDSMFFGGGGW